MNDKGRGGWEPVLPNVEIYRDSCNVYAVSHPGGTVFVNAGTGHWLDDLPARFRAPHTLLCTHYFRDHAAGAANASRRGMRGYRAGRRARDLRRPGAAFSGAKDLHHLRQHLGHFRADRTGRRCTRRMTMRRLDLDGLVVSVVPLPGVTPNHTGYALSLPGSGRRIAFSGEAIHSPGRMARIAPLQYRLSRPRRRRERLLGRGRASPRRLRSVVAEPRRADPFRRGRRACGAGGVPRQALRRTAERARRC